MASNNYIVRNKWRVAIKNNDICDVRHLACNVIYPLYEEITSSFGSLFFNTTNLEIVKILYKYSIDHDQGTLEKFPIGDIVYCLVEMCILSRKLSKEDKVLILKNARWLYITHYNIRRELKYRALKIWYQRIKSCIVFYRKWTFGNKESLLWNLRKKRNYWLRNDIQSKPSNFLGSTYGGILFEEYIKDNIFLYNKDE